MFTIKQNECRFSHLNQTHFAQSVGILAPPLGMSRNSTPALIRAQKISFIIKILMNFCQVFMKFWLVLFKSIGALALFPKVWCYVVSGMCGIIAFIAAEKSLPAAAPLTSKQNHCAWAISVRQKSTRFINNIAMKRTDLIIEWSTPSKGFYGDIQRIVIELKILYGSLDTCIQKGLAQTAKYADQVGAGQAHLMIFNRDETTSWDNKVWQRHEQFNSRHITIWGC